MEKLNEKLLERKKNKKTLWRISSNSWPSYVWRS